METLSFAFGMLAMVAVALVAVIVVGMVKVFKMQERLSSMERIIDQTDNHLHTRISNEYQNLDRVISDDRRELSQQIENLNRYVDSRFDKMESKFMGNSAKKQVING